MVIIMYKNNLHGWHLQKHTTLNLESIFIKSERLHYDIDCDNEVEETF